MKEKQQPYIEYRGQSADYRRFRKLFDMVMSDYKSDAKGKDLFSMLVLMRDNFDIDADKRCESDRIAESLKSYRHEHKLSQIDLAFKLGCGRRQIIRWEKGTTLPHNDYLRKMAEMRIG